MIGNDERGILKPLTDAEKKFIRDHHSSMSVLAMAKHLKRATKWIYDFMDKEDLKVFRPKISQGSIRAATHIQKSQRWIF